MNIGHGAGQVRRVAIPAGRDPFINTPLISLGIGDDGYERFWISTWNSNSGALGALVTETGECRVYRFAPPHSGFYSAAPEDGDTLWLCGDLSRIVRLTLSSGEIEVFETGAPSALVFQGMTLDHHSGKLFALAYPPQGTMAVSFDYRRRQTARIHENVCGEHYMAASMPHGDGTYSIFTHTPSVTRLHWSPQDETLQAYSMLEVAEVAPREHRAAFLHRTIRDEQGAVYFTHKGWYQLLTGQWIADGPRPARDMSWLGRQGDIAWGLYGKREHSTVVRWDMTTGEVSDLCAIANVTHNNVTVSASGKIVAVSLYGDYSRFDGCSGALEISKRLPTDSIGSVDCLCRITEDRLLGTPFITQRFWEVNLETGEGYDCGRAAPGVGEVLLTWNLQGKIYLAAYTDGELMEYDPQRQPNYPENPRVVADPPGGMRPVAGTQDGHNLYYSCSHHYGNLGCVIAKYNIDTGLATYLDNPVPNQMIRSLCYNENTHSLLAGTTMHADCNSCPPLSSECFFVRLDAETLAPVEQVSAPVGTTHAQVHGALDAKRYLCSVSGEFPQGAGTRVFALDLTNFEIPALEAMDTLPDGVHQWTATRKPGLFVLHREDRIELWDMNEKCPLKILHQEAGSYHMFVQDDSVYLATSREIVVLDGCLL